MAIQQMEPSKDAKDVSKESNCYMDDNDGGDDAEGHAQVGMYVCR